MAGELLLDNQIECKTMFPEAFGVKVQWAELPRKHETTMSTLGPECS